VARERGVRAGSCLNRWNPVIHAVFVCLDVCKRGVCVQALRGSGEAKVHCCVGTVGSKTLGSVLCHTRAHK